MKQAFEELRKQLQEFDEKREELIVKSREIVKSSKLLIYSIHRDALPEAEKYKKEIEGLVKEINAIVKGNAQLESSGSMKVAIQEYVEAICSLQFIQRGTIPSAKQLKVEPEFYVLGLTDLSGELVRMAVHAAIAGNNEQVNCITEFVSLLYGELLKCNFRNGEVRKKFDGIKYDLKKLEDLVLELKLKKVN